MIPRIGFGFDVHRLSSGHPMVLGGVHIPSGEGPVGHSDADVLIHAICDALLGAAGLNDIGHHFPDTDPQYKGVPSTILLKSVVRMLHERHYHIGNVDVTLVLQQPKIAPHIKAMQQVLGPILGVTEDNVSIKATTTEKLGYAGRGEGLAAYAVALIYPVTGK